MIITRKKKNDHLYLIPSATSLFNRGLVRSGLRVSRISMISIGYYRTCNQHVWQIKIIIFKKIIEKIQKRTTCTPRDYPLESWMKFFSWTCGMICLRTIRRSVRTSCHGSDRKLSLMLNIYMIIWEKFEENGLFSEPGYYFLMIS